MRISVIKIKRKRCLFNIEGLQNGSINLSTKPISQSYQAATPMKILMEECDLRILWYARKVVFCNYIINEARNDNRRVYSLKVTTALYVFRLT